MDGHSKPGFSADPTPPHAGLAVARAAPMSRAEQISAVFKRLSAPPDMYVVYVSYSADEEVKAKRAASDLRNGRVAAFAKAFPNSVPDVTVLSTEDASRWMVLLKAVPKEAIDPRPMV